MINKKAEDVFDIVIIGGGPAGYTAALYAARAGFRVVVLEKTFPGGQMLLTHQIDNYPGFEDGVDGFTLSEKMKKQAERFGAETVIAGVVRVDFSGEVKLIETTGKTYFGKAVILAMGANPRELGLAHESELVGKGVTYCASCDGMFYKDKEVIVVGGGNTAAADALILSRIAKKVTIVHRRDTLKATRIYHEPLKQAENVDFCWDSKLTEFLFDDKINGVRVKNVKTGKISVISCDGVFISIGRKPATEILKGVTELDENGYVVADESTCTNIPGVYAVGDIRTKELRQVVTAVSDGAVAVHMAEKYFSAMQ